MMRNSIFDLENGGLTYTRGQFTVYTSKYGMLFTERYFKEVVTFDGIWVPSVSKKSPNNNIQKHQRTKSH